MSVHGHIIIICKLSVVRFSVVKEMGIHVERMEWTQAHNLTSTVKSE